MVLTKLYVWTFSQYKMVLFLKGDTLTVQKMPDFRNYTCANNVYGSANVYSLGMEADEEGNPNGSGIMVITLSLI